MKIVIMKILKIKFLYSVDYLLIYLFFLRNESCTFMDSRYFSFLYLWVVFDLDLSEKTKT